MYKPLVILCVVFCVIEARPTWQWLPPRDGYIPVYIRPGDTPLEEINPDLAEAFHALPAGRSAGKQVDAAPDTPEQADQPSPDTEQADQPLPDSEQADQPSPDSEQADQPAPDSPEPETPEPSKPKRVETPEETIDRRPYEKKLLEKKNKKATEILKPVERR